MILTAEQVRLDCAVLRWGSPVLAERSGVPYATICSVWAENSVRTMSEADVQKVHTALEAAGVEFTSDDGQEPKARLRKGS